MWKGAIAFGLVNIPIELYSAVRDHRPKFRLLHAKDESPVSYERVCQSEGKPTSAAGHAATGGRGGPYGSAPRQPRGQRWDRAQEDGVQGSEEAGGPKEDAGRIVASSFQLPAVGSRR
jgi:hypothetical protein